MHISGESVTSKTVVREAGGSILEEMEFRGILHQSFIQEKVIINIRIDLKEEKPQNC